MSKLNGIKDFIEKNKESLEKMNKEMIASYGSQPLVWLTVEEAEILIQCVANEFCRLVMEHGPVDLTRQVEILMYDLTKRIEQAKSTKICDNYNNALNKVTEEFQKQEEILNIKCEIDQLKAEQEVDNYLKNQFLKKYEEQRMKVTEEMILLLIQKRHERLKEYVDFKSNGFVFISSVEQYINKIKPLVDEMYSLLKEYKEPVGNKK